MNKCIYCLKDEKEATFNSREHIIPDSIGGQRRLSKGFVCDTCNNGFSTIEKRFIYDSLISLPKQFHGPKGRSGTFKTNLHPMKKLESDEITIGYIEQGGFPKHPPQFKILKDDSVIIITDPKKVNETLSKFINAIKTIKSIITIEHNDLIEGEPILCFYKTKIFSFVKKSTDSEKINKLIDQLINDDIKFEFDENILKIEKGQVNSHQTLKYSIDDVNRVLVKMILNGIAYYFGHECILKTEFDNLRKYVLYNTKVDNFEFVSLIPKNVDDNSFIHSIKHNLKFPQNSHVFIFGYIPLENNFIGICSLYDGAFEFLVRNTIETKKCFPTFGLKTIVIDYVNNTEYELFEEMIKENIKLEKELFRKPI